MINDELKQSMTGGDELGGKLLEGVSRSFYLTLKALPQGLREPLSLAYLLARAADTMADTVTVADAVRLECLHEFDRVVQGAVRDEQGEAHLCLRLSVEFAPYQQDASEARLLERLPEAFAALRLSPQRQVLAMQDVLSPIVRGQVLDIERFPVDGQLRALSNQDALDEYTWLVAGCVGEFWTKVCASEVAGAFSKDMPLEQMMAWGVRYGKGLQLVNILRDVAKDLRMGRCYLPEDALKGHGISLQEAQTDPARLLPVMRQWQSRCREHLEFGLQYLDAVQSKRVLYATSLPLLLGLRTLTLLEQADDRLLLQDVKVSRGEVSKILFDAGLASLRKGGIRRLAGKLSA